MTPEDEPGNRLIARLKNTLDGIADFTDPTHYQVQRRPLAERLAMAELLLRQARRVVAREGALALPAAIEPTEAGIAAAMAAADGALQEFSVRYGVELD